MLTVEEALMTRLGDATLQTLLGGANRIYHAHGPIKPQKGSITYFLETETPSLGLNLRNVVSGSQFYMLNIFADNYEAIKERIYLLLQDYRFPTPSDAGIKCSIWDWTGPDEFDEALQCGVKRVRYKLDVVRSAQAPV